MRRYVLLMKRDRTLSRVIPHLAASQCPIPFVRYTFARSTSQIIVMIHSCVGKKSILGMIKGLSSHTFKLVNAKEYAEAVYLVIWKCPAPEDRGFPYIYLYAAGLQLAKHECQRLFELEPQQDVYSTWLH